MTRKLFSTLLCAFALLLLMGAGVEESSAVLVDEDASRTDVTQDQEADQREAVPASAGASVLTLVEDLDRSLTVDGQPVPASVGRTLRKGSTYVALAPMAQCLDASASAAWNGGSRTATVTTADLTLTARVGELYLVANGRYLYLPEGVQMEGGRVIVPLSALAEAFGDALSWNSATGAVAVTRRAGSIQAGSQFYQENDLFWLSRVIYAESGNQSLEGKMAVGNVILNRVKSPAFPGSIEGVLAQKNQFTTYHSGYLASRTPNEGSVIAAKLVMDGGVVEETKNALYFDSAKSSWASRNRTCVAVIGGHRFYA